jgi:hypothetical protein
VCGFRHGEFFSETGVKGDLIRTKMLQFPKANLMDALQRYSMQNPDSTAPKTKKPDSSVAKARQMFERVTGVQDTDNFLTLTWLTMDELKKPQQSQRLKYLFDESKGASTKDRVALNTLRTTLEEARAIVYAAARHVDANGDNQNPAHMAQKRHLAKAYQEFGSVLHPLREQCRAQRDRRHKSERQKKNWSDLDAIRRAVAGQARLFLRQTDVADTRHAWKDVQQLVAASLYVLIPPSRKDIMETAFLNDPSQDNIDDLISNGIANYIDMSGDQPAIVINNHKTNRLHGELIDDHDRTRRFPASGTMEQTETLDKLGFDVELCAKVLVHYAGLIDRHLGARNPLRRLFFVYKPGANVEKPSATTLGDRLKWFFYKFPEFVGKSLGCQMLRTITVTELHSDASMDTDELRQLADWMGHQLQTAQREYTRA